MFLPLSQKAIPTPIPRSRSTIHRSWTQMVDPLSSSTDGRSQGTVGRQMVGFRNAWRQIRVWTVLLGAAGLAPAGHGTVLSRPGSRCRFLSQCRCLTLLCLRAPSLLVRRPNHRHTTKPRLTLQLKTYAGTKSFHWHTASCTKDRKLHSICSLGST